MGCRVQDKTCPRIIFLTCVDVRPCTSFPSTFRSTSSTRTCEVIKYTYKQTDINACTTKGWRARAGQVHSRGKGEDSGRAKYPCFECSALILDDRNHPGNRVFIGRLCKLHAYSTTITALDIQNSSFYVTSKPLQQLHFGCHPLKT